MTVQINKGHALSNLSLTPLIDVVFLLLIFFLVATRFEEEERSMEIDLPEAAEAQPLMVKPKQIIVNITKDGRYIVSRQEYAADQLARFLQRAAEANPGRQDVLIRPDGATKTQRLVKVMDLCNKANLEYTISTVEPAQ